MTTMIFQKAWKLLNWSHASSEGFVLYVQTSLCFCLTSAAISEVIQSGTVEDGCGLMLVYIAIHNEDVFFYVFAYSNGIHPYILTSVHIDLKGKRIKQANQTRTH